MSRLTAVVITKNEEDQIIDCLEALHFADARLVVDNQSSDRTVELSKHAGARVIAQKFNDFAQQRNYALHHVDTDWVLYVDADERVSELLKREIINTLKQRTSLDGDKPAAYRVKRKNFYFGKYEWPHTEHLERLFVRKKLRKWVGKVHESPQVVGVVGELNGYLLHYTHRDLSSMLGKTNEWSNVEADLLYRARHPSMRSWRFVRIMLTKFWQSYIGQSGWRAGSVGLIESMYQAFSYFIVYAKLWEMQQKK